MLLEVQMDKGIIHIIMNPRMHGSIQQAEGQQQTLKISMKNILTGTTGDIIQSKEKHQGILSGTKVSSLEIVMYVIILGTKQ